MADDNLTPSAGARFAFEREDANEGRARYRCTIATPSARYVCLADLDDQGSASLAAEAGGTEAPADLLASAVLLARVFARAAPSRRAEGMTMWPPRFVRWRGPGRGQSR